MAPDRWTPQQQIFPGGWEWKEKSIRDSNQSTEVGLANFEAVVAEGCEGSALIQALMEQGPKMIVSSSQSPLTAAVHTGRCQSIQQAPPSFSVQAWQKPKVQPQTITRQLQACTEKLQDALVLPKSSLEDCWSLQTAQKASGFLPFYKTYPHMPTKTSGHSDWVPVNFALPR